MAWWDAQGALLKAAAEALKAPAAELPARVAQLVDERKKLEREVADLRKQIALGGGSSGVAEAPRVVNGINFISRVLTDVPAKDLKPMADEFKAQVKSGVIALSAKGDTNTLSPWGVVSLASAAMPSRAYMLSSRSQG